MLLLYMTTIECPIYTVMIATLSLLDNKKVEFRPHYKKRGGTEKPNE